MEVVFVPQQFATIQQAVDAVRGPATIVVQPGTYRESIRIAEKESIVLQSARLSRRGVTLAGGSGEAVIEVRDATLHMSGIAIRSEPPLPGIIADGARLNLQECVVCANRGGIIATRSNVHLQKSAILANVAGGVRLESCDAEIAGCTLQANAGGPGLFLRDVKLRMWRSRVTDNFAGGVHVAAPRRCDFGGSVITGNDGGGIFVADGRERVAIHRNTFVRQNHPTDVEFG